MLICCRAIVKSALVLVLQLLLYCSMSVSPRFLTPDAFTFAFPCAGRWASMVAYGGLTCRIPGYRFWLRNDAYDHELRFMLLNTLRTGS